MAKENEEKVVSASGNSSASMKAIHIQVQEDVVVNSDNLKLTSIKKEKAVGFRETGSDGRQLSSDSDPDGIVKSSIRTRIQPGERNVSQVGQILAERMSSEDTKWSLSGETPPSIDIDCQLISNDQRLNIQATRADQNPTLYRDLADKKDVNRGISEISLAEMIKDAIDAKATRIAPEQRVDIVLVLDAIDTPDLSLDGVAERFREHYGQHASRLNFRAIWLVGPTARLTHRLA